MHELHDEGGIGVKKNTITRRAAAYTTNARIIAFLGTFACPAQQVWLPGNDLQDPATWIAPSLCQLKHMHEDLLQHYDCTDQPAAAQPAPPPGAGGSATANAGANPQPQPAGSQDNDHGKLVLPQLNRLHEAFKRSQVSHPASGVRFPTRRLPALRTSSPLVGPAPFRLNAASRSSSPSTGPNSRPCVSTTLARGSRSIASSTCLKSTRPRSRNQACAWR